MIGLVVKLGNLSHIVNFTSVDAAKNFIKMNCVTAKEKDREYILTGYTCSNSIDYEQITYYCKQVM